MGLGGYVGGGGSPNQPPTRYEGLNKGLFGSAPPLPPSPHERGVTPLLGSMAEFKRLKQGECRFYTSSNMEGDRTMRNGMRTGMTPYCEPCPIRFPIRESAHSKIRHIGSGTWEC